ncbi:MAG: 2-amino-4-hydroxy-6-hydroxymethyldihydropteridine diphosphokinase [Bacteroidales bacterium]|nr:2-amino-4-hydroxy-6-hydroxymethyldihydropteridine diphosphokinase [Bacteroidales bacterium]
METCHILFGSNMGDKNEIFAQACLFINNRCGRIVAVSSAYESEPWGFEAEEWFMNRLISVETELEPEEMMQQLLGIEAELGRVRHPETDGYTSRTADLDILYYGCRIVVTDSLVVPHPRLHQRRFALMPLCEMLPQFVHPAFKLTQTELLERCPDTSEVRKID